MPRSLSAAPQPVVGATKVASLAPDDVRRLEALKAAVLFARSRPDMNGSDVLKLADRCFLWLLGFDD
jgi:hypothetical protein